MEKRSDSHNPAGYDVRLLEVEAAMAYGVPFSNEWYSMPVRSREVMIAARLGRQWLDSLVAEENMEKSR